MATNQQAKDDAIRRQILLEGVKTSEAEKFQSFLKKMDVSIRERLIKEGVSIENKSRLAKLLIDLTALQTEAFKKFSSSFVGSLEDIALAESKLEATALNEIAKLSKNAKDFEAVLPAKNQILTAFKVEPLSIRGKGGGLTLDPFIEGWTTDQINLVNGRVAQGFAEGQTNSEIAQALRGTAANKFKDGVFSAIDKNAKIFVRTAVQNASTIARDSVWNENSGIITGVEWVSTLDSRTTEQCQALDGQIFPLDAGPRPPIHYGCRSTTAPVFADDLKFLDKGATRPAVTENEDGVKKFEQVSTKTTYYEFLKAQPDEFIDKVIGINRRLLLKSGGLTVKEFQRLQLDKNFEPRTLSDMVQIMEKNSPAALNKWNKAREEEGLSTK